MNCNAHGRPLVITAPDEVACAACGNIARRQTSVCQNQETTHHHYRCLSCPAGGVLIEHRETETRLVYRGPVFKGADLAVRLALKAESESSGSATRTERSPESRTNG